MNFLRLVCIMLLAILLSMAFLSCSKEEITIIPRDPPGGSAVPVAATIQGIWAGKHYGPEKNIPVYFGFIIKDDGKLDVLDSAKNVIGSGSWKLNSTSFKAGYINFSSGVNHTLAAGLFYLPERLVGTWGHNGNDSDGGFWNMARSN